MQDNVSKLLIAGISDTMVLLQLKFFKPEIAGIDDINVHPSQYNSCKLDIDGMACNDIHLEQSNSSKPLISGILVKLSHSIQYNFFRQVIIGRLPIRESEQ